MYGYPCEYCEGTVQPHLVEREAFKPPSCAMSEYGSHDEALGNPRGRNQRFRDPDLYTISGGDERGERQGEHDRLSEANCAKMSEWESSACSPRPTAGRGSRCSRRAERKSVREAAAHTAQQERQHAQALRRERRHA